MSDFLLSVEGLTTEFHLPGSRFTAVDDVSFTVRRGETLGLVGESGSGKSVTAFSLIQLVASPGRVTAGRVFFGGRDLLSLSDDELCGVRGAGIGVVFQEPMAALNPIMRIGAHIVEALEVHGLARGAEARARALDLLRAVQLSDPERQIDSYPHELSGGMRQRAMLAIALACRPPLLIADEPTTALDVTVQAAMLDLLRSLQREWGLGLLLITHDFGVIAEMADRVAVMYAGRIVEQGPVRDVLRAPAHPYTRGLIDSMPGGTPGQRLRAIDGTVPSPDARPAGCAFAPRCRDARPGCAEVRPREVALTETRRVTCHLYTGDVPAPAEAARSVDGGRA
jgi:oligopeptide/dipeptide ABC transporter ATP-binding protein